MARQAVLDQRPPAVCPFPRAACHLAAVGPDLLVPLLVLLEQHIGGCAVEASSHTADEGLHARVSRQEVKAQGRRIRKAGRAALVWAFV